MTKGEVAFLAAGVLVLAFAAVLIGYVLMAGVYQ